MKQELSCNSEAKSLRHADTRERPSADPSIEPTFGSSDVRTSAFARPQGHGWAVTNQVIIPALAGCLLGIASLLPWLKDPLGKPLSAWQLPIDLGWQLHSRFFNYGLLCCLLAIFSFCIAIKSWRSVTAQTPPFEVEPGFSRQKEGPALARPWPNPARLPSGSVTKLAHGLHRVYDIPSKQLLSLLCLLLPTLFLAQYLYADMGSIAQLANHEIQMQLIKMKFGYGSSPQLISIQTILFDPITMRGRTTLLLDYIGIGSFIPLASALLLLLLPWQVKRGIIICCISIIVLIGIIEGRAPIALVCNYQAQHALTEGDYSGALHWLDWAEKFNPSLDQLPSYHIERGHAWYFLHPEQPTTDSQIYLAAFYRQQRDFLSSYQELLAARRRDPQASWIRDEFTVTLEDLAETAHPLNGPLRTRVQLEISALNWLSQLSQADPDNIYAHYVIGRIEYDLQDYAQCEVQMAAILARNPGDEIASSVYTYLALSHIGQGDTVNARDYLFKAEQLDPAFRNNIARQELSGLR